MYHIFAGNDLIYQPGNENLTLLQPKLTVEMGKSGSLEFSVPPTHRLYDRFQQLKTVLTVYSDEDEIFRGRVFSNKRNFSNIRDIYGEGNLSYLVDSVQKGEKYKGKTHALFKKIIEAHNNMIQDQEKKFTVGEITVEDRDIVLAGQSDDIQNLETNKFDYKQIALNSIADEWKNTYDYIESCLIEYCGGYLRTRRDESSGITYIDWLKDYYALSTQTIEIGKNILDLTEEISAEDVFTVLIPLGDENLTIKNVNNGSIELVNEEMVAKYGRIVKTNVFDSVNNPKTLLENGKRYLTNESKMLTTITVNAVDLHFVTPSVRSIFVGDKVRVISPQHKIDNSDLICTKIEYDLANPANTTYTFGNPKQSMTERYRKDKAKQSGAAGRGGGGGGAAAKKSEEAKEEADKTFFSEWINYDPTDKKAHIDLGSLCKAVAKINGVDMPVVSKTLMTFDSDPEHSSIDLAASYVANKGLKAKIKMKTGIDLDANDSGASVDIYAMDKITGKAARFMAKYQVDENGVCKTIADISADQVNITSKVTKIDSELTKITGCLTVGGTLAVDRGINVNGNVTAKSLFIGNNGLSVHRHEISCDSRGVVTLGGVLWPGQSGNSFNIADTKFYKDAVVKAKKDVKVSSVTKQNQGSSTVKIKVTLSNGVSSFHNVSITTSSGSVKPSST